LDFGKLENWETFQGQGSLSNKVLSTSWKHIYYSTGMAELDVDAAPQWERSPYT
jgi:hypothetical protein